jgi:transcription elongation GreA/GreB family factor
LPNTYACIHDFASPPRKTANARLPPDPPMSVAFTKEGDAESVAADLPDRPISPHPNLVTPQGLALIEASLAEARAAFAAARVQGEAQADRTAMARATRDLRYYGARRASAQLTTFDPASAVIRFGAAVTVEREDGSRQVYRLVGEDEADPAQGAISYLSPVARALLGKGVGDEVVAGGQDLEIVAVGG